MVYFIIFLINDYEITYIYNIYNMIGRCDKDVPRNIMGWFVLGHGSYRWKTESRIGRFICETWQKPLFLPQRWQPLENLAGKSNKLR